MVENTIETIHTEEMEDIITRPPAWLLRWGILLVFLVISGILLMAALIQYPETVHTRIKVNTANAPKAVVSGVSGNISKLLVKEGEGVSKGQPLSWMESTADHQQVLDLIGKLQLVRKNVEQNNSTNGIRIDAPDFMELGELQAAYQAFYQSYISYRSAAEGGLYLRQKAFLMEEMAYERRMQEKLMEQQEVQQKEYDIAQDQYNAYKILADRKVISRMEMQDRESRFLASQRPLQQTASAILSSKASYLNKEKELATLENQIASERSNFLQQLNSMVSEALKWKKTYVLTAPQDGQVVYAYTLQDFQYLKANEPVFYINTGNTDFFCEMYVSQDQIGKIKEGQRVFVRMQGFPYQEYGELIGEVSTVSAIPYQDSLFLSNVSLIRHSRDSLIQLKVGMLGNGNVITERTTLLSRLVKNVNNAINMNR